MYGPTCRPAARAAPRWAAAVAIWLVAGPPAAGTWAADGDNPVVEQAAVAVSPSTGLADLQPLVVTGTGFVPLADITVSQCALREGLSGGICLDSTLLKVTTEATGVFSASTFARRIMTVQGGSVDCAETPGRCGLTMGDPGAPERLIVAPLDFDPDQPATPPAGTVDPATELRDGQQVTVTGSGHIPHAEIKVAQCRLAGFGFEGCDPSTIVSASAGSDGAFSTPFEVRLTITDPDGVVTSCAGISGCAVVALNARGPAEHVRSTIAFAAVVAGEVEIPGEELPRTGAADPARLLVLGVAALGVGKVLRRGWRPGNPS